MTQKHHARGSGLSVRLGIVAATVRTRLKSIQYRPSLIDAFVTETGLVIQPQPP